MAYYITDDCVSCGICKEECPVQCITEGKDKYEIDEIGCIECGACATGCPANAILDHVPEDK